MCVFVCVCVCVWMRVCIEKASDAMQKVPRPITDTHVAMQMTCETDADSVF